jgi:hypothetical protein
MFRTLAETHEAPLLPPQLSREQSSCSSDAYEDVTISADVGLRLQEQLHKALEDQKGDNTSKANLGSGAASFSAVQEPIQQPSLQQCPPSPFSFTASPQSLVREGSWGFAYPSEASAAALG